MGKLYYQIAYSNADEIFYFGLHEYLTNFINDLIDIGDEINHTYFGYV
ncbi:MAG: alpha-E domain-containing protein [Leptospiraceae bacterium]|nr:alpha-E domain-containing protein [Leptospiraceae bacterium]